MKPIFGYCFFTVATDGFFTESIVFEYSDPDREYERVLKDEQLLREELRVLKANMQSFIDEERLRVNGVEVKPKVVDVDVGFTDSVERPYINFIVVFNAPLRLGGLNVYEDEYEPEEAEYDYIVKWVLPRGGRVVEADFGFEYVVGPDNVLRFRVRKGEVTPGRERMVFYLPPRR